MNYNSNVSSEDKVKKRFENAINELSLEDWKEIRDESYWSERDKLRFTRIQQMEFTLEKIYEWKKKK